MKDMDKYCVVMFDEMAIEPSLTYIKSKDFVRGFQDNGEECRTSEFCDKAMVFMARGVFKKWKQPISYYLNSGGMKTDMLVKAIKNVVRELRKTGLKIIGIVCDQGSSNRSAINKLYVETRNYLNELGQENHMFGVLIDGEEVVPLFDPPHLLKCIRNTLYSNDASYIWRNGLQIAKWSHIRQLYELEDDDDDYKLCHKLTDAHVNCTKKMKVSIAAQVFSARVAAAMKSMAKFGAQTGMPSEAVDTAEFLLFMDKLFDSVNGSRINPKGGKRLRVAISSTSEHMSFWQEAITVLQSLCFHNIKRKTYVSPSVNNWVHTLQGLISHGARNINPDANAFVNSFKTLIINNYMSYHSPGQNCEEDKFQGLSDLRNLLNKPNHRETNGENNVQLLDVSFNDNIGNTSVQNIIRVPGVTDQLFFGCFFVCICVRLDFFRSQRILITSSVSAEHKCRQNCIERPAILKVLIGFSNESIKEAMHFS
ncbi:hypothetical protein NQ315_014610 [Exocentrus adspersus]|uniref:Transposable element P transposase n=1 Tax=Exocentrus adspersus TaxID=1586481 RepID=A0AAV8VRA3_9CUCU|nr:hypothetical protein NQ315_014610 [Exocentrus adspersus]